MTKPATLQKILDLPMTNECLIWRGKPSTNGYGKTSKDGKTIYAHRLAWEKVFGSIPVGMHIDHICNIRLCVNVNHLELVTQKENNRRMGLRKNLCKWGHPRTPDNRSGRSSACKECVKLHARRYRARRKDSDLYE